MDETLIQFGSAPDASSGASAGKTEPERRGATVCPVCSQHFSPDGRFCPFDGEPLRPAPDWDPHADPLLGSVVDNRYDIQSVIGEGGMGVVYAARHRSLGKRFALKALRKDLATDPEIAARFLQEARMAASVSHPGLVEITDFGRLPTGQPFFVMELLEGQSLAQLIRRGGPVPAARAVELVRQIADALGAAHDRSIVHRDLKPDNIHVSDVAGRDRVTIVDFGLAKVIGASRLTRAGMVFGTPHYMSPEQAQGDATDHRADIYALGVVMYEMFTGRVPFEADSYMGVLTKHMYMAPTPPSQLALSGKLGVLEDITLRCLEKKPAHRYQALRELSRDLELAMNPGGEPPSLPRQRRATPRSLLADELELPSREERAPKLAASALKSWPRWPLLAIGALFLTGIAGVLGFRSGGVSTREQSAPADVVPTAVGRPPSESLGVDARPPLERGAVRAAPSSSGSAIPAASGTSASTVPSAAALLPARAVTQPSPRAAARSAVLHPVATPVGPQKPIRLGNSEIVDPWAK